MKYEITEEQIKDIAEGGGKTKIKSFFPEAFETKFKVGKWYKSKNYDTVLFFVESISNGGVNGYGLNYVGDWVNSKERFANEKDSELMYLATESEVFEYLKKEAVKRGFVDGAKYLSPNADFKRTVKYPLQLTDDGVDLKCANNEMITSNGKWAEIIKETPESFLDAIFKADFICKTDREKHPNSIFYFQGETILLEIEKRPNKTIAWVNYSKILNPISTKFGLNHSEIQQILKLKIEIKGFEVYLGADTGANKWTLSIPKLKIFNTYEIKKDPISAMVTIAKELINQNQQNAGNR